MKEKFIIFILLVVNIFAYSSEVIEPMTNDDYALANKLYEQKRYDLALQYYQLLLLRFPTEQDLLYKTGYCLLQTREYDQAVEHFLRLYNLNNEHEDAIMQLAYTLKILQRHREARLWYDKLRPFRPKTAEHHFRGCEFAFSDYELPTLFNVKLSSLNSNHADFFVNKLHNRLVGSSTQEPINREHLSRSGPAFHVEGENSLYWFTAQDETKQFYSASRYYSRNVGPVSFAPLSGLIAYGKNKFTEGVRQVAQAGQSMSIHFAYLDEANVWVDSFAFDFNSDEYSVGYPYLTPDGETLYFASDMPGGYGGFDIYVSYFIDSTWTIPQNLGPRINTPGDEISPFFDGSHLYFSSDWHHGYGGLDIFKADFNYESWTDPINLGPLVNSSFDDFNFTFFDALSKGYFCSDRPTRFNNENIFEVTKRSKTVTIHVNDFKEGKSITGVEVDLSRCGVPIGITDEFGKFTFEIQEGFDCYVSIIKVGYTGTSFKLSYNDISGPVKKYTIRLSGTVNFFEGRIVEDSTLAPIKGVYVSIVNELDGELQETYTDIMGKYALHIKPLGRYHISFAKSGYLPFNFDFKTETKVNPKVLGTINFRRADNLLISDFYRQDVFAETKLRESDLLPDLTSAYEVNTAETVDISKQIVKDQKAAVKSSPPVLIAEPIVEAEIKDKVKAQKSSTPRSESPKKSKDPVGEVAKQPEADPPAAIKISDYLKEDDVPAIAGYVIQVAAMARKNVDITPFKYYLSKFGEIYVTRRDDNLLRIMVGVFDSKQDAEEKLLRIRAEKFSEAFITPLPSGVHLEPIEAFAKQINSEPKNVYLSDESSVEEYLVSIGEFKNMLWFDNKEVEKIGLIEERKHNGRVNVFLSGFRNKEEAQDALGKVKELGYKGAKLMKNGKGGALLPID